MTRYEIRTLMRTWMNDDKGTTNFWSDDQLNTFIDLANKSVNGLTTNMREDYFTAVVTFPTVAGVSVYQLPTDFRILRRLERYGTDASQIYKLNLGDFPNIERGGSWPFQAQQTPDRFLIVGNKLRLFPTPDAVYNLRLYYDRRQDTLSTDDMSPTILADYHDLVALKAVIYALPKNSEASDEYKEIFGDRQSEYIKTLERSAGDDLRVVQGYLEGYISG